jgi:hypothetical protein
MQFRSGIEKLATPESAMSLERFLFALALASSMLGPGLPASARAAVGPAEEPMRVGMGLTLVLEHPEHDVPDPDQPRFRASAQALLPIIPNVSGLVGGSLDAQGLGAGEWGGVDESAFSADVGLRISLPFRAVIPYCQATFGVGYVVRTYGESAEASRQVDDDPSSLSPHVRTALGLAFPTSATTATRLALFVGLDASYYSYERRIDLGYSKPELSDYFFGDENESRLESWKEGRLSPSLGFEVAFAP